MDQMHNFVRDEVLPSWFANALTRTLSLMADNLVVAVADSTHVEISASAGAGAAIAIQGRWRWVESNIVIAHPGGGAGSYPMFVTAADNDIVSTPQLYTDDTNYAFDLKVLAPGVTPTIVAGTLDIYRQVGVVVWDGMAITRVIQSVPSVSTHSANHAVGGSDPLSPADIAATPSGDPSVFQAGDIIVAAGTSRAGALLCQGQSVSRTAYPALFAAIGTLYGNGDGSTTFTLPDYRGRVIVGAGEGTDLTARALGDMDGEENNVLSIGTLPAHSHGVTDPTHPHSVTDPTHAHGTNVPGQEFAVEASGGEYLATTGVGTQINFASATGNTGTGIGVDAAATGISIQDAGSGDPHNNMQPFATANIFIKL